MKYFLPNIDDPVGRENFVAKLCIRAAVKRFNENAKQLADLVECMEWLLITIPNKRMADMIAANAIREESRQKKATYMAERTQTDYDYATMRNEIIGQPKSEFDIAFLIGCLPDYQY